MYFLQVEVHPMHPGYRIHTMHNKVVKEIPVTVKEKFGDGCVELFFDNESDEKDYDRGLILIEHVVKRGSYYIDLYDGRRANRIKLFLGPQGAKKMTQAVHHGLHNSQPINTRAAYRSPMDDHFRMMDAMMQRSDHFAWEMHYSEEPTTKKVKKILLLM